MSLIAESKTAREIILNSDELETTAIEFRNVSKSYREGGREHYVLNEMDFVLPEGEIIVLLGRSGSGKSTILNLISGIDLPTSGEIMAKKRSLSAMDEEERTLFRRQHIGFIFQFFNLIPTLTVLENLLLPLELNDITGKEATNRCMSMLDEVGLANRSSSFPDMLSGGEQQRIAIARALIHEPDIVLADEPTGNLDAETGAKVIDLLDRLIRKRGKTMIMATHSRDVIRLADKVYSMKNGTMQLQEMEK